MIQNLVWVCEPRISQQIYTTGGAVLAKDEMAACDVTVLHVVTSSAGQVT